MNKLFGGVGDLHAAARVNYWEQAEHVDYWEHAER